MATDRDEEDGLDPESYLAAKSYIEGQWREAMDKSREAMEILRSIHPDLSHALGDNGQAKAERSLDSATLTYASLHELGYYVLGEDGYKKYLDDITLDRVQQQETR